MKAERTMPAGEPSEDTGFEELGLDARLVRAISKRGLSKPTPIQLKGIPLILEGKDVVARAKTGSGKTLAYLLPMVQKLLTDNSPKSGPSALILVPSRELCQQVHDELRSLFNFCGEDLRVVQLATSMSAPALKSALAQRPNVVVSTPGCIAACITDNTLPASSLGECLSNLVCDEADLLLSYGYEDDLQKLAAHVPRRCQCILMSATTSEDVDKLKKLVLHNPVTLTLTEEENSAGESVIPSTVQQFKVSCTEHDKFVYLLTLLRFELLHKKVLIFVNSIDTGFKVKLFLEQFSIKSAVLNSELPQNSRLHILKEFNMGLFDYMIATDDGKLEQKLSGDLPRAKKRRLHNKIKIAEFGVVRGIDFKNVNTVVNFDMPRTVSGYVHRIGRTGRAGSNGVALSLVSEKGEPLLREIEEFVSIEKEDASKIPPFPSLTKNAVDSLRYRAEDVARGVTRIAIRDARAKELKIEILNSNRLKAHFEDNPTDMELLKHDKILSKETPVHLRTVPDYLRDPAVEAAGKALKSENPVTINYTKTRKRNWEDDPVKAIGSRKMSKPPSGSMLWSRKKSKSNSKSSRAGNAKHTRRKQ